MIAAGATSTSPILQPPDGDWQVVLARDGTVLAATDGAPHSWVGMLLPSASEAPEDARQAARELLGLAHDSHFPIAATVRLDSIQKNLHLTVVEAMPLRRTATDIRALLRSSLDVLRQQAKDRDVTLDIVVDDLLPQLISIDPDKIAWVTSALVGNALRYVRHGSRLMPGGSVAVRVGYQAQMPAMTIEVQDDGPGIPQDRLPFLFTGPNRVGLGLLMVRDIVVAHAGHIEIDSDSTVSGRGTMIRLTLPVS